MEIKIIEQFDKVKHEPLKAIEILSTRLKLYREARQLANITDNDRLFFGYVEGDILNDISLFWTRIQFDEQTSEIISRLDNLENDVNAIKAKLNIS